MTNRELDALVAERILGLFPCDKWESGNFGSAGGMVMWKRKACEHEAGRCYPDVPNVSRPFHGPRPYYTAPDWSMAGEVIAAMTADGYVYRGGTHGFWEAGNRKPEPGPWATFVHRDSINVGILAGGEAFHENQPKAIVLAAMKAKGLEVPT